VKNTDAAAGDRAGNPVGKGDAAWIRDRGTPQPCPYCESTDTRREAVFGPFHMSETYFCRSCGSPFSRIKWREEGDPGPTG
jgi:hypothetical protein